MNLKSNPAPLETVILALSFVLMWVWYLGRQRIYHAGGVPSPLWHLILAGVLAALVWVFARRLKRVTQAMREQKITISQTRDLN